MHDNKVVLLGYYGGDDRVCLSAWQSTNVELDIELSEDVRERVRQLYEATVVTKTKSPRELLHFLAEHKHTSPFRKSYLDFQITGDIASHIHCLKHTVGCEINSESARYKELRDKWYLPKDWAGKKVNLEAIEYESLLTFLMDTEFSSYPLDWQDVLDKYSVLGHKLYHLACDQLAPTLGRKRAKESARYFLPYNKQLDYDMQMSFQAFIHFQNMRNSEYAQVEIQAIAQQMLELVRAIPGNPFRYSLEAFGY
jgi:flavin-dependent thymidylate synthase